MRSYVKHISLMMIAVLGYFVAANTLFVHSHIFGTTVVMHSHPFSPKKSHTHTANQLALIAVMNQAAETTEVSEEAAPLAPDDTSLCSIIESAPLPQTSREANSAIFRRGPPMGIFNIL